MADNPPGDENKPKSGPHRRVMSPPRYQVGDRVVIARGVEQGEHGEISMINPRKRRRYVMELGSSRYVYCTDDDLRPWLP
jgi:transcription antitermination factor NusG